LRYIWYWEVVQGLPEHIKCGFQHHPTLHPSPRGVKLPPQTAMS